jgi:RNA polymerase sigma-70 factor (ECF subfamily)
MSTEFPSDEALIASIQGKDTRALEVFHDRHRVLAYSLALRMLGDPQDAQEVVQEGFLNVWRAAGTYQAERSMGRSWLLSIIHHRAIDKLRSRQSRPLSIDLEEGLDVAAPTDVWREVSGSLTGEDVRQALNGLPTEQRETIELAYFKGYTHTQIAQLMEVPLGTVKGRMRIGLHKLKAALENSRQEIAVE